MWPKLDATKQAQKGSTEKITAFKDQISVKEGTMVWKFGGFFYFYLLTLIMFILIK